MTTITSLVCLNLEDVIGVVELNVWNIIEKIGTAHVKSGK